MLIKSADDKTPDLESLQALMRRPDASAEQRKRIEKEVRNIQSGVRGEREATYEIEFHYGQSCNWMTLHDLRLECEGRVAQIDHLLINRLLEFYVCESKRFAEGVAINEHGEFTAFFNGRAYGVASPLEQNRRHIAVLESVFKAGKVALPRRLGIAIKPTMISLVLVSKTARISRPRKKLDGIESVIKNDQLRARIEKDIDAIGNPLVFGKLVGQDTLEGLARALADQHRPIQVDWAARFGLAPVDTVRQPTAVETQGPRPNESAGVARGERKSKLVCSACGSAVSYAVAKFCWVNKPRFGGLVYCMDCQKAVPRAN